MKKLLLLILSVLLAFGTGIYAACSPSPAPDPEPPQEAAIEFSSEDDTTAECKEAALSAVDTYYAAQSANVPAAQKTVFESLYKSVCKQINALSDSLPVEEAKTALLALAESLHSAAAFFSEVASGLQAVKAHALAELEMLYDSLISYVNNVNLDFVSDVYETVKAEINAATAVSAVQTALNGAKEELEDFVKNEIESAALSLVQNAKSLLESLYSTATQQIHDNQILATVETLYKTAKIQLSKILTAVQAENIEAILSTFRTSVVETAGEILELTLSEYKAYILAQIDAYVNPLLETIPDDTLKASVQTLYSNTKTALLAVTEGEDAKETVAAFLTSIQSNAEGLVLSYIAKLKEAAIDALDTFLSELIAEIDDEGVKTALQELSTTQIAKLDDVVDLETAESTINSIVEDTKDGLLKIAADYLSELLKSYIETAVTELTTAYNALLALIPDDTSKAALKTAYNNSIAALEAIDSYEKAEDAIATVKEAYLTAAKTVEEQAVAILIGAAKENVEALADLASPYLPDGKQDDLQDLIDNAFAELEQIDSLESAESAISEILSETEGFITELAEAYIAELKEAAIDALDTFLSGLIAEIDDEGVKTALQELSETQIAKLDDVVDLETAESTINSIVEDTKDGLLEIAADYFKGLLNDLIDTAETELTTAYNALLALIPDDTSKAALKTAYDNSIAALEAIDSYEEAEDAIATVKEEYLAAAKTVEEQAVAILIGVAKEKAEKMFDTVTGRLAENKKADLKNIFDDCVDDLLAIDSLETASAEIETILSDFASDIEGFIDGIISDLTSPFGEMPEQFTFLPSSFAPENRVVSSIPDYNTDFYSVSNIPTVYIGKALNVVYSVMNKITFALDYVETVFNLLGSADTFYTLFLENGSTEDGILTATVGELTVTMTFGANVYYFETTVSGIAVKLFADKENGVYGASIKLSDTIGLKYTAKENYLKMAMNAAGVALCQVELIKSGTTVTGSFYETLGDIALTTSSATLLVKDEYTTVVGSKGDFIPKSTGTNVEVYDNATGAYLGSRVKEVLDKKSYDTTWYNLYDVDGITSIKKQDKENVENPDTIWINGSSETIHTKVVSSSIFSLDLSRRFDIEFKKVYGFALNQETGEYESVEFEVPLMFIQTDFIGDFESDYYDNNKNSLTADGVELLVSDSTNNALDYGYTTLLGVYEEMKGLVTPESIATYCNG